MLTPPESTSLFSATIFNVLQNNCVKYVNGKLEVLSTGKRTDEPLRKVHKQSKFAGRTEQLDIKRISEKTASNYLTQH